MSTPPSGGPPGLATRLLELFVAGSQQEHLLGDLEEEFRRRVREGGPLRRHELWYWGQVVRSLPPLAAAALSERMRRPFGQGRLAQDLRFAFRGLRRRPGFAAIALLTLTVGIGINTAAFSAVRAVVLRPLPFDDPSELILVRGLDLASGEPNNLSPADFMDIEAEVQSVDRMGAHGWIGPATLSDGIGQAERLGRVQVTEGYFPTLGVEPALGGLFSPEQDQPDAEPVVILSDGLWRRMFGADPTVIGRSVLVNAEPATVVGVLPASYRHIEERPDRNADFFMPFGFETVEPNRGGHFIRAIGRVGPRVAIGEATAELETIAARLEQEYSEAAGRGVYVNRLHDEIVGDTRGTLFILLGAAGLVLLIACANMGNLLLAEGASREREMSVRAALGASRPRLARQLLTECVVIGALGGIGGVIAALLATPVLTGLSAAGIPRAGDIGVDIWVLGFGAAASLAATVAFGLFPAIALPTSGLGAGLRRSGRQGSEVVAKRPREMLIAAEVALSVVLLVGAGLLVRTLMELRSVPTGFEPTQVVTMEIAPPLARYPEGTQIPLHREFEEGMLRVPGVEAVGASNILPLTANYDGRSFFLDDQPLPRAGEFPQAEARSVTAGYFDAMGISLIRGRLFDDDDGMDAPLVTVVSEAMAELYWPGEDPIGQTITYSSGIPDDVLLAACPEVEPFYCINGPASRQIVGIVEDVKHLDLREAAVPMFYTPNIQAPSYHAMTWVVRSRLDPAQVAAAARSTLSDIDIEIPLSAVRTLDDVVGAAVAEPRVRAGLIGLFALLALILACVGVYGVVSFLVARRVQEIGVRMALGASDASMLRMLVRDGMRPIAIGIGIGVPVALAGSQVLEGLLFGVTPLHPFAYGLAVGALGIAGLAAILVPARRALSVRPSVALTEG